MSNTIVFPVVIEICDPHGSKPGAREGLDYFRFEVAYSTDDFPNGTPFKILGSISLGVVIDKTSRAKNIQGAIMNEELKPWKHESAGVTCLAGHFDGQGQCIKCKHCNEFLRPSEFHNGTCVANQPAPEPVARSGETEFAAIIRNRSGMDAGEIDFSIKSARVDELSEAEKKDICFIAERLHQTICSMTGYTTPPSDEAVRLRNGIKALIADETAKASQLERKAFPGAEARTDEAMGCVRKLKELLTQHEGEKK